MVFWNALDISKKKIIRPSADTISMMMQMEHMPDTGAYDTVNSTPSIMDDLSAHVLEYISYWLSMSVVFTLIDILVFSIFVFGVINNVKMVH